MNFDEIKQAFMHAHVETYGNGIDMKDKLIAEKNWEELKRGIIKEHFSNMGRKQNKKKGFGSNPKLASDMGKKHGSGKIKTTDIKKEYERNE